MKSVGEIFADKAAESKPKRSRLRMWVMATAGGGATTAAVSAPTNSIAPVVSGNVQVGQTLSTTDGTWSGSPTFTYQWKRAGVDIASATNNTYLLAASDAGKAITCAVTGTNAGGNASATSNSVTIDIVIALTDHAVDTSNATTYTFTTKALGTASTGRVIVVAILGGNGGALSADISTVTVAGNSATRVLQLLSDASSNRGAALYSIVDASNTTGTIVVTYGATQSRCGIAVYAITGASGAPATTTNPTTITAGTATGSSNLTIPANGVGIAASYGVFAADQTATWTGYTEKVDEVIETLGNCQSSATLAVSGAVAAQVTWSGNTSVNSPMVHAVWGP